MKLYESRREPPFTEHHCTEELTRVLGSSSKVAILLQGIQALNKHALRRGITCRPCAGTNQQSRMGYYDGSFQRIVLCCDNIRSKEQLEETLVHELVHAFDTTRKGKFSSICHLIACGEVRASVLGQCANVSSEKQKYACVWRDAVRSTAEHCGGEAERVVREVFENCVKDDSPFTR